MKYLTIIRHAKSSWESPGLGDMVRPLNERGKKAILRMGAYLRNQKINPDLIITSPATRALHTAIGIGELLNYNVEEMQINREIYFGNTTPILTVIKNIDNQYNHVFMFGHEPILSSLIFHLTKNELEKFPTCSVYCISFDVKNWKDICAKKGKCEFFVNPKLLMEK